MAPWLMFPGLHGAFPFAEVVHVKKTTMEIQEQSWLGAFLFSY